MNFSLDALRSDCVDVLRQVANPVAVVTAEVDGRPWGVTVSSFLPVSMDPPQVLVSLFAHTPAAQSILQSERFGVSLLDQNSAHVASALSMPRVPKFMEEYRRPTPHPVPADELDTPAVAESNHFHCRLSNSFAVADHVLFIGEVQRVDKVQGYEVLVYRNRTFGSVVPMGTEGPSTSSRTIRHSKAAR